MTNERARTELEQLYMSLSEEKKKALDVAFKAMEQADNIPEMYYPQVDGITPTVLAQADGKRKMRDATPEEQKSVDDYIKSISKPTGINFWDLDGNDDCISRKAVLSLLADHFDNVFDMVKELPSVAIPPDHDGCKDCRWQSQSETEMPCKQCMHNYTDEWQKKPHWKKISPADLYECSECGQNVMTQDIDAYNFCHGCGSPMEIER